MSKYGKIALTILSAILSLVGCAPPTRDDILGTWIGYYASNREPAGSFEFFEDGTFEARDIPVEEFLWAPPQRIDAQGTWELDVSSNDPFAVHRIILVFLSNDSGLPEFESVIYIFIGGKTLFTNVEGVGGVHFEKQR